MVQLLSITITPDFGLPLRSLTMATLVEGVGIEGDRYAGTTRQVTVVCTGEIAKAAAEHGGDIDPVLTRRNLVVDLPDLPRIHGARLGVGGVELSIWRDCAPCDLMDEAFGEGARQALKLRAGVSARVVKGGVVSIGDPVVVL